MLAGCPCRYDSFSFDITSAMQNGSGSVHQLLVEVTDPSGDHTALCTNHPVCLSHTAWSGSNYSVVHHNQHDCVAHLAPAVLCVPLNMSTWSLSMINFPVSSIESECTCMKCCHGCNDTSVMLTLGTAKVTFIV